MFPYVENLEVKYNQSTIDEMKEFIMKSFPSTLSSFKFIGSSESNWMTEWYNSDKFSCLRSIGISNASIGIEKSVFDSSRWLEELITIFSKAKTIEFNQWEYHEWDDEETKFEGVQIKNLRFKNCKFASAKMLKKVCVDSGLVKTLDEILIQGWSIDQKDLKQMFKGIKAFQLEDV